MRVAIHHRPGSFSERWIQYCKKNKLDYLVVNALSSNIIEQLHGCDIFFWHHHHAHYKDVLTAKRILFALEHAGVMVFPDFKSGWHFDDKVAQKYLLEAINAPVVPSYVFYDKSEATEWAKTTKYPKVFKLKGGAGATNVKLVKSEKHALKLIKKSFKNGFTQFSKINNLTETFNKYRLGKAKSKSLLKALARLFITPNFAKLQPPEQGYAYFQDFIEKNTSDLRVIIIDNKAFAIKRLVRENDFRASGSGNVVFDKEHLDVNCVKAAFEINKRLGSSSVAYDFIWDDDGKPLLVEISYGFAMDLYDSCPGYWDNKLEWHDGKFIPQDWMIEAAINTVRRKI
ncbi:MULTISPECIES: ATP-grasp domain-containing protein [unclassified Pseudoalteromonas]|uniref:ATP-grasp domain-containing protein n=1 Tax=unclassified Pseudoalteromonas TaxID=194690 RepID=UPI0023583DD0|nr:MULTISPECIES: hypothetical protein [unclassified Pseudoalteromonas]MDC9499813.1 hypothetical protein [Pseudoalteromonas sp. Angola-20]MDC9518588.1 hypothetical protein [Pseudoalteromonas sp. Angola-22]MDC9534995.1 hypothetical protein [Pseudoalteromonas sp. Angola-9]